MGASTDEGTRIGLLANAHQYAKVVGFSEQAVADGARVVVGGPERPEGLDTGYYVRPTVLADVVHGSRV